MLTQNTDACDQSIADVFYVAQVISGIGSDGVCEQTTLKGKNVFNHLRHSRTRAEFKLMQLLY